MLFQTSNEKFTRKIRLGNIVTRAFVALTIFLIPNLSYAGAWTQDYGKGLFIQNISYYSTNKYFDNSGNKQSLNNYSKYEFNPYVEYGLRDWLTVGANIFAERSSQDNSISGNNQTNWGIADSEFFIRSRLWQKDAKKYGLVFSVEPMVKLPSLDKKSGQPQIGNKNSDAGLTFSGGYSFKAWELDHFINIDAGYRHRFGTPNDQIKFAATAGLSITKNTKILAQIFSTSRIENTSQPLFTQSSSDDYDLTKLQISAIYKIDDRISFQVGAFSNVAGRNIGSGDGGLLAISKEF